MAHTSDTVVDLEFPVRGETLPADHGFSLFGGVCRVLPWLHAAEDVGIHPIRGRFIGGRALAVGAGSRLTLRLGASRIHAALPLAGRQLDVDGSAFRVGVPTIRPLVPVPTLVSRLVVVKGYTEPASFLHAVRRHAAALGIDGRVSLIACSTDTSLEGTSRRVADEPIRRTLRICDRTIVGFAVVITDLTAAESFYLQEVGLGGRRHFGCGVFLPVARRGRR